MSFTLNVSFPPGNRCLQANIFVAAQRGDIDLIRELIESGKASATDKDDANMCVLRILDYN